MWRLFISTATNARRTLDRRENVASLKRGKKGKCLISEFVKPESTGIVNWTFCFCLPATRHLSDTKTLKWVEKLCFFLWYLCTPLSRRPCRCGRSRLPDMPRRAGWPPSQSRSHSHRRWARRTARSRGGNSNTPLALCPQRASRDSLAHSGPRGGSGTPHSLHREEELRATQWNSTKDPQVFGEEWTGFHCDKKKPRQDVNKI